MNLQREGRAGAELTPQHASLVVLVVACIAHYWICRTLASDVALDVDPINLVYGMREFNVAHYAPHPPGYLIYIWLLRGLHSVVGGDPFHTVQLAARLLSTATIPLLYAAVRILRPQNPMTWAYAAALGAFHPFLVFHAVDAQTHTAEAFAAGLLLVGVLRYRRQPSVAGAVMLGALLALGSALRPSFVVAGVGPVVWAIGWRRPAHLVEAGATSIVGAVAWLWPTLQASDGYARWKAANDALVEQVFVRVNSPLSADSIHGFVLYNMANTSLWLALLVAPPVLVMIARIGSQRAADPAYAQARSIALWTVLPSAVFYLSVFCSEPGYLLGAMPAVVTLTALGASGVESLARRRVCFGLGALAEIAILAMPTAPQGVPIGKVPSIPELVGREAIYTEALTRIAEQVPPGARVLYVTDYIDITFSRQLPLHQYRLHSMIIHSEYWPIFEHTTIGLATQDDWIPVPGPILLQPGPPTIRDVPFSYDFIVVGLVASSDLRNELRKHTTCSVDEIEGEPRVRVLPAQQCFPDGVIEAHGQGIRFRLPDSSAASVARPTRD
ncbi:MAG: hypothetical protein WAU39_01760 [Polyangiales bacterium]